jgi:hypothetical protein
VYLVSNIDELPKDEFLRGVLPEGPGTLIGILLLGLAWLMVVLLSMQQSPNHHQGPHHLACFDGRGNRVADPQASFSRITDCHQVTD